MRSWEQVSLEATNVLRQHQEHHGPSQRDLAAALGMSQSTVSHFLIGRFPNWKVATLVRMATALGFEVEIVFRRRA